MTGNDGESTNFRRSELSRQIWYSDNEILLEIFVKLFYDLSRNILKARKQIWKFLQSNNARHQRDPERTLYFSHPLWICAPTRQWELDDGIFCKFSHAPTSCVKSVNVPRSSGALLSRNCKIFSNMNCSTCISTFCAHSCVKWLETAKERFK